MRYVLAILAVLGFAATAQGKEVTALGEEVIASLSQTRVAITTGFTGSEIFIYGAIKRERPVPPGRLDVIVTVTGPDEAVIIRKKERQAGVWINGQGERIQAAPSLYAISTTGPLHEVMSYTDDLRYSVSTENAITYIGKTGADRYREEYVDALVRLRRAEGLYFETPGGVTLKEDTLFETRIALPAQLTEGDYKTRVFLARDREVIDVFESSIAVRKVGLERWLFSMAHDQSLLYGILSIAVALAAGWLASTFFRIFFP